MRRSGYVLAVGVIGVLLVVDIFFIGWVGEASIISRVSLALQLLGAYNLGIGFLAGSQSLQDIVPLEAMTSSNIGSFLRANRLVFATGIGFAAMLVRGGRLSSKPRTAPLGRRWVMGLIGAVVTWIGLPLSSIIALFYLIAVMPIAYLGYVVADSILQRIMRNSTPLRLPVFGVGPHHTGRPERTISIIDVIIENPPQLKGFLVGLPSVALGIIAGMVSSFLRTG
jgi:hypothetical protein